MLFAQALWAIPAPNVFWTEKQPDGTVVEVRKRGNEFSHHLENREGQIIKKDKNGFYKPAQKDSVKHFKPYGKTKDDTEVLTTFSSSISKAPALNKIPAYQQELSGSPNVLVVLVQFNDTKFISEDPATDIGRILLEEGYDGDNSVGSATDFFRDNSLGNFIPNFDIVGPITVSKNNYANYGSKSKNGDYGAQLALGEALDTLKKRGEINFKKYDNDGDGIIEYVHMIFAGFGAHDSDQDSAIWPHRWLFRTPKNMGASRFSMGPYIYEYACNAERDGFSYMNNRNSKKLFGVGNFLHEFSHILGLPDLYATNSNNKLFTLGDWDIMDHGAYNTNNRNGPLGTEPPFYSAFERMTLGWLSPKELAVTNDTPDTLYSIQNNVARKLENPKNKNEFFLLEHRSKTGWDRALPAHGMLIWHIDFDAAVWDSASINNTEHLHVDIEEADGIANSSTQSGDAFPGTGFKKVNSFNQFITWDETDLGVEINKITEDRDFSYVTFDVAAVNALLEAPEDEGSCSSSATEESSSSETESDTGTQVSSSSLNAVESSSSGDTESSSSEDAGEIDSDKIYTPAFAQSNNNEIKTLHVFSLNGQLLDVKTFAGEALPHDLKFFRQPLLLSISQNGKVIKRSLFIFRE